jgi:hypothetical protein
VNLIEYFERQKPVPKYAQITSNGNWEHAVRLDFGQLSVLTLSEIDASIAGEIFYELNDGHMLFVGLRYSTHLRAIHSPDDFAQRLQELMKNAGQMTFVDILKGLGQELDNNPETYLSDNIDYVELGVEGYWKSLGSLKLRQKTEHTIDHSSLSKLLSQNPNLIRNTKNHTALEFAVNEPEHWFGLQVSKKINDQYVTDWELLECLVNLI